MSFVYYNYGDSIIDELGYNFDSNNYNVFKDADFHNSISIDGNQIEENMGSYSYIENITNYYKMFYAHAKANQRYTYQVNLKNYDRRFYYLKPNILIIKEDIEALPDITREYHVYGYKYKWNVNSKLPITFDNESNKSLVIYMHQTRFAAAMPALEMRLYRIPYTMNEAASLSYTADSWVPQVRLPNQEGGGYSYQDMPAYTLTQIKGEINDILCQMSFSCDVPRLGSYRVEYEGRLVGKN